ncbi:MAG: glycosyltransferase family 4 protein [Lachnospiraceae bacterium]|nr:glycosyltransferase family 4 protein [Lachnospiraceae bacterium]
MRVLFLFQTFSFKHSTIYLDLIREMRDRGHEVTLIAGTSDVSDGSGIQTVEDMEVLFLQLPDQFGKGRIKKGLIQLTIGLQMKLMIKDLLWKRKFDLIAYPTPPVTLAGVVEKCHKHYRCITYLMLKDIFPQNAVDLGMMKENGLLHRYFRRMEKKLYAASDRIGCMSEANVQYVKEHNPEIPDRKLEYFPNTVRIKEYDPGTFRPGEALHFMFGGNMGRPQGIPYLLEAVRIASKDPELSAIRFSFVGDGTESRMIEDYIRKHGLENITYRHSCPREEYEQLLSATDIGIVSLSPEFTIPNYPSRILSYMQIAKPVLCVTDPHTDMRQLVTEEARCGYWAESGNPEMLSEAFREILHQREGLPEMGLRGRRYLERYFSVGVSADILERAYRG